MSPSPSMMASSSSKKSFTSQSTVGDALEDFVALEPLEGFVALEPLEGFVALEPLEGSVALEPLEGSVALEPLEGSELGYQRRAMLVPFSY